MTDAEFERHLAEARSELTGITMRLTGNADAARDLAQETLLLAWKHRHKFTYGPSIVPWLSVIARNQRRNQFRKHQLEFGLLDGVEDALPADDDQLSSLLYRQLLERVALKLDEETWEMVLGLAMGSSYEELSESLSVPIGTIKSRVFRARQRLTAALGAC